MSNLLESSRPIHSFLTNSLPILKDLNIPNNLLKWSPNSTPLSTIPEVIYGLTFYLILIFGGQKLMSERKAFRFQPLFMLHNALLSSASFLVLILMLEEVAPILYANGPFYSICHTAAWTPRLETLYIINYYFKWWELIDTVFLVVKKKELQFLHVFHHTATALLCFTQLNGRTSVSWVPISANLIVHVFMYYYYFMTAAGYKIWWKKYLTTLQITQFVLDLGVVYFAAYSYFGREYLPHLVPTMGSCSGTEGAAAFGCVILTSYLVLFVGFYRKTYKKPTTATTPVAAAPVKRNTGLAPFKKQQ